MTNITERLRSPEHGSKTDYEAAAEIERLRAALRIGADTFHRMEQVLAAGLDQMAKIAIAGKDTA